VPGAVLAFVASRVVLVVVATVAGQPPPPDMVSPGWAGSVVPPVFAGWDTRYYVGIARDGYHLEPDAAGFRDWAFFPALPILMRVLSAVTGWDLALAGVVIANCALLAGLLVAGIVIAEHEDANTTTAAQALIALGPGAVAFGLAYSDSLAFAASAGIYLAARHGARWAAGLLLALATLTRPTGILLAVPLAILLWEQAERRDVRAMLRRLAPIALGPLALLGFAGLQGVALGDPLAFLHAQADWSRPSMRSDAPFLSAVLAITLATYSVAAFLLLRSKLPRAAKAVGLMAYLSVVVPGRLLSNARFMALGWSIPWMLARQGRVGRLATIALSACGFILYATLNLSQHLPP
jgi:hypothetical protein